MCYELMPCNKIVASRSLWPTFVIINLLIKSWHGWGQRYSIYTCMSLKFNYWYNGKKKTVQNVNFGKQQAYAWQACYDTSFENLNKEFGNLINDLS